jgi:hypothetical protein
MLRISGGGSLLAGTLSEIAEAAATTLKRVCQAA